jgi:hypothetical protein
VIRFDQVGPLLTEAGGGVDPLSEGGIGGWGDQGHDTGAGCAIWECLDEYSGGIV